MTDETLWNSFIYYYKKSTVILLIPSEEIKVKVIYLQTPSEGKRENLILGCFPECYVVSTIF